MGAKPAAEHKPMSGTNVLERAVKVQENLQHKKMRKTSITFGKCFIPIVV